MADRSVRIEPSDRAQLMLVGAVAIALVIVGIVVVYNTVLYSDTQTATGTTNDARQAEAFSQQVRTDLRTLGGELKRGGNLSEPNLTRAVRNWSAVQSRVHANTDPAFVAIDPGNCSGICTSGSQFNATVIWESQDFEYSDSVDVRIPFPTMSSTVYAVQAGQIVEISGNRSSVNVYSGITPDGATTLGPRTASLDSDNVEDIPFVDTLGQLKITDGTASSPALDSSVENSLSRLAVGRWNGSPPSVFYVKDDDIWRTRRGVSPTKVLDITSSGYPASGVLGIDDVDNDSTKELVYVDDSQTVRWVDPPDYCGPSTDCPSMANGDVNSNLGVGAGGIADFDGDGRATVVATTSPGNLKLIGAPTSDNGEGTQTITSISDMAATPPAVADVDFDDVPEIVYVNDGGYLKYVDEVGNGFDTYFIVDETGSRIAVSESAGVSGS